MSGPRLLVQDWRFNNWRDGDYSRLRIEMEEVSQGTTGERETPQQVPPVLNSDATNPSLPAVLRLRQTGIPYEDKFGNHDLQVTTENGWKNMIFNRIRTVFGF